MEDLLGDEELERVFEFIGEAEDSGRLESVKREAQGCCSWRPRPDGMQDRPDLDRLSSDLSSTKKTQWVGWTVNSTEWGPFKDALATEESWMRLQGWQACIAPAFARRSMASGSPPRRRRAAKEARGVMVAAALRHGLATPHGGAGDRGIDLCRGRVLAFHHSGIVPGGALILSVCMHTGAGLTQENWQIFSTIGQWTTSQALPFIIGGDFQVEPKQLEDSGWARAGHSVASGHPFLHCLPRLRRRA